MLGSANPLPGLQAIFVLIGVPFLLSDPYGRIQWMWLASLGFAIAIVAVSYTVASKKLPLMGGIAAGLWSTGAMICLVVIHQLRPSQGLWDFKNLILIATLPLWLGDSAAYLIGKSFGRYPLAPTISPKKTIEGSVVNLVTCVASALAIGYWIKVPIAASILCGISAGIFGQAGDLFESWVKRGANLKNSSELLPGHGGVMDRLDSLLFNAPIVAIILSYMAG